MCGIGWWVLLYVMDTKNYQIRIVCVPDLSNPFN